MKHTTVLVAALALVAGLAGAQEDTIWARTWLAGMESPGKAVAASGSDIFSLGAAMQEFPDLLVIKYDTDGDTAWVRVADIDTMETAVDIAVGSDGQPVVCARVDGDPMSASVVKFTGTGDTAWTRHLDYVMPSNVAVGAGDAVYLWGSVFDTIPMKEFKLARYGSDGTLAWEKTLRLDDGNQSAGCCADADGNIIATGTVFGSGGPQPTVMKFNSDGDTVWTRSFADLTIDALLGVAAAAGDTLMVVGSAGPELRLIRLAGAGDTVWTRTYPMEVSPEDYNNVAVDAAGETAIPRTSSSGYCELFKVDRDGATVFEGASSVRGQPVAVCFDGDGWPVTVGTATEGQAACLTIKLEGRGGIEEQGEPAVRPRPEGRGAVILDPGSRLAFEVPVSGQYRVRLYSNSGALVRDLHSGRLEAGQQELGVPGLAARAYTLRVEGPRGTAREKLVQVR